MKYSDIHFQAYCWSFFTLLKYPVSTTRDNKSELGESSAHQPNDLEKVATVENSSSSISHSTESLMYEFTKFKLEMKITNEWYCESAFSPIEVEVLLDFDMKYRQRYENWWRQIFPWGVLFSTKISNPICSDFPNKNDEAPSSGAISDHEYFQMRNIRIPIKAGKKGQRLNKYEHLKKEPVWKAFLECDCEMVGDVVGEDNICIHNKIVNLSRGVGGDRSFFVHALNSSGSYKVVAHICFK